MVKSKLTTVWTESTSGVARPASRSEAVSMQFPVTRCAAPAEGQNAVDALRKFAVGAIAERARSGIMPEIPEQERDGGVGRDREDIPD